jgi:hypothetical protein
MLLAVPVVGCSHVVPGVAQPSKDVTPNPYAALALTDDLQRQADQIGELRGIDPCGFIDQSQLLAFGEIRQFGLADYLRTCQADIQPRGLVQQDFESHYLQVNLRWDMGAGYPTTVVDGNTVQVDTSAGGADCAYVVPLLVDATATAAESSMGSTPFATIIATGFATKADGCASAAQVVDKIATANTARKFPQLTSAEYERYPLLKHNACEFFNHLPHDYKLGVTGISEPDLGLDSCDASVLGGPGVSGANLNGGQIPANQILVSFSVEQEDGFPVPDKGRRIMVHGVPVDVVPNDPDPGDIVVFRVGKTVDENRPQIPASDHFTNPHVVVPGRYDEQVSIGVPAGMADTLAPIAVATFAG